MTRTSTGKLPLPRQLDLPDSSSTRVFSPRLASGDVKEKMEQQLRAQREANNKKRAEEMKQGELDRILGSFEGFMGIDSAGQQFKTVIRKVIVRNPDGTTRVVNETTTIAPKTPEPQKIQVMRGPDGKMSVRGLQANQKLVQTADGKYLILPANSSGEELGGGVEGFRADFWMNFSGWGKSRAAASDTRSSSRQSNFQSPAATAEGADTSCTAQDHHLREQRGKQSELEHRGFSSVL
jgi:hypothetical protein